MREEPGPGKGQLMGMVYVFPAMYSVEGVGRQTSLKGEPELEGLVAAGSEQIQGCSYQSQEPRVDSGQTLEQEMETRHVFGDNKTIMIRLHLRTMSQ